MYADSNNISPDRKLIKQIASGNEHAFAHFYDKHWESLFKSAFKVLNDEETSKDIVQDVFLNIWEKPDLTRIQNVAAYLHQAVRFKVLMTLRKGKISDKHIKTLNELVANTTEEQLNYKDLNDNIEKSLNSLPEKCQKVFRLSRMEHLSNHEIANRLGISIRTVETHISNALKHLRSNLDSSAAILIMIIFR